MAGFQPQSPGMQPIQMADARVSPNAAVGGFQGSNRGGVAATPQTMGGFDESIPAFMQTLVEPYIKRKQQEMFVKGMADQRRAGAETEMLDDNGTWVDQIFGPTAYREGASMFRAQTAVAQKDAELQGRMDDLVKLPPKDFYKVLGDEMDGMNTGDQWTDAIIQKSMTERMGPLIDTVAKGRIAYQQHEARNAWVSQARTGASAYHSLAAKQMGMAPPTEEETRASGEAQQNFFNLLPKPPGMTDKAYRSGLTEAAKGMLQDGSFYAYESLKSKGLMDMVDPEDAVALDTFYKGQAHTSLETQMQQHEDDWSEIDRHIAIGDRSPHEISAMYMELNQKLRRETGINQDYFDAAAIAAGNKSMIGAVVSRAERNEERLQSHNDRLAEHAQELADRQAEAATNATAVKMAFNNGTVITTKAEGKVPGEMFDDYAVSLRNQGNYPQLVGAYNREGYYSPAVASLIQAPVKASIGVGYTKDAERAYNEYKTISSTGPSGLAAASQYYGDQFLPMADFDRMVRGGTDPSLAWKTAFDDPSRNSAAHLNGKDAKDANTALDHFIANDLPKDGLLGATVTDSGKRRIRSLLSEQVALTARASGLSMDVLVRSAYTQAKNNGTLEQYGKYGWTNSPNTTPLTAILKVQPKELGNLMDQEVTAQAKALGFHGASDFTITRRPDKLGLGDLTLIMYDNKGNHSAPIVLTVDNLRKRLSTHVRNLKSPTNTGPEPTSMAVY